MSSDLTSDYLQEPRSLDYSLLKKVWEWTCNIVLGLVQLRFVVVFGESLITNFRISALLVLIKCSLFAWFTLFRRMPAKTSRSPYEWFIAVGGTWSCMLVIPSGTSDILLGQLLQSFGTVFSILAMYSLNKSFGIVPANRGIQTNGLYRIVRHPLYAGYVLSFSGFLLNNYHPINLSVLSCWLLFELLRAVREERFLSQDPEYRAYMKKTRYRIIPGIF